MAVETAPELVSVTEPTVCPFCRPLLVNSVPAKTIACPKYLLSLVAVMVKGALFTVSVPLL